MSESKVYTAIGLMSGTSLDGIDAAMIRTDGHNFVEPVQAISIAYEDDVRARLRGCLGRREDHDGHVSLSENKMTEAHAAAVQWLLSKTDKNPQDVDLIGFHGHTIFHDPDNRFTWQIGKGAMLARLTGIDVINDFRTNDVLAGGQGAPFLPLYHQALLSQQSGPVVILNLGGVGNVTYIDGDTIIAFDTGPANALIDDFVRLKSDRQFDENGLLAANGALDEALLAQYLDHPYFTAQPPKSLDRDEWNIDLVRGLALADGAATLAAFTVAAVEKAFGHFPKKPTSCYVTGGGRHNTHMMRLLASKLGVEAEPVEALGWDGDSLEAQGFGYLAVRSHLGLPTSVPQTTGVPEPITGGRYYKAA
jgi:anhydro-N-acetylmuramic acid kinase